jgi:uncharacterized protein (DUF433 family)
MTPKEKVDLYRGKDPRAMPAYGITEAAHYLQIPRATLRSWLLGRHYETERGRQFFKPLIDLADKDHRLLSFFNLVEAHILNALRRKHQVSLAKVRAALDYLKKRFPSRHPLADREFETDGSDIFLQRYGQLINLSADGQLAMRELLQTYLHRIEAVKVVVVDPRVSFGRPVLAGTGIATDVIAKRYKAGDSIAELADDYDRSQSEIEEAIRCELYREAA